MAPSQQPVTDFTALLDNPPDIIARREELFHLRNGTIRLTPQEFDRYWPYMTNAWHKHSTHAKPATASKPVETRIFWCRNGRADGRASLNSQSRGLRRRLVEDRPQCPVKMSIIVHYAVQPDSTIGPVVMYELSKKSGGEHKESLRSIDSKRRNEKVIEACTQHLLENEASPTHYVAKMWKEDDRFRLALEDAGGSEVGPDDAQNYVRQAHLSRLKKSKPKRDSIGKSTGATVVGGSKFLDPEVFAGIKAFHTALPALAKSKPPPGDIMSRRQALGIAVQHFNSILPPLPTMAPDPTTGIVPVIRERDLFAVSSQDGLYIPMHFIEPPAHSTTPPQSLTSCMLYLHPGAMIASGTLAHSQTVQHLVHRTGVPALSVEYRLAPEFTPVNTHPVTGSPVAGAVQDAFDALTYLRQRGTELGIDASRIVVVGEGGGGAVAAGLCHYAVKRGSHVAKQVLCSPMLDDRPGGVDASPTQASTNGLANGGPESPQQTKTKTSKLPPSLQLWTATDDATAWSAITTPLSSLPNHMTHNMPTSLPHNNVPTSLPPHSLPHTTMALPPNVPPNMHQIPPPNPAFPPNPLTPSTIPGRMAEPPRNLASLYIDVGEHDILRDECVEYAKKCWIGGIGCELHVWPGAGTWFCEVAPRAGVTQRAWEARVRAIVGV